LIKIGIFFVFPVHVCPFFTCPHFLHLYILLLLVDGAATMIGSSSSLSSLPKSMDVCQAKGGRGFAFLWRAFSARPPPS
jgi:hypothetical protein